MNNFKRLKIMEKGLIWLPLLGLFIWLAWAGRNEMQKVEAYRLWAKPFQQSKYDIYAALGYDGKSLIWGKPTPHGLVDMQTLEIAEISSIDLSVDGKIVKENFRQNQGKNIELILTLTNHNMQKIPFTEIELATTWVENLRQIVTSPSNPINLS